MRRAAWAAALAGASLLAGCALPPQTQALRDAPPAGLPARVEQAGVPFFPQTEFECGPAALATALGAIGIAARPEALSPQVYLPARQGSLQTEMLAAARRQGALAVRLPPRLEALLRELAAGQAPVVLLNLGLPVVPRWHYAVVVGYDLPARELLLRSGETERAVFDFSAFERTWARSGHWAFVAMPPGRLPATADENEVAAASVAYERVAAPAAAQRAYAAALARWPDNLTLAMGLGNARHAGGDLAGAAEAFEAAARRHDSTPAWINLAQVRMALSQPEAAARAASRALARSEAEPAWRAAAEALATRLNAGQEKDSKGPR